MKYFRTRGFRALLTYLVGAIAQAATVFLFGNWFARTPQPDYCTGIMGMVAIMLIGPQVVFVLCRRFSNRLQVASGYLGLSVLLPLVFLMVGCLGSVLLQFFQ